MAVKFISSRQELTQERLFELLSYDPLTGIFLWNEKPRELCVSETEWKRWNTAHHRKEAGSINGLGYHHVNISGFYFFSHRLAWLYVHGEWPPHEIDHINGRATDNRISNLRLVTGSDNSRNRSIPSDNTSGVIGVRPSANRDRWMAEIFVGSEKVYLGTFDDVSTAQVARKAAERVLGYHENHGRPSRVKERKTA